MKKITIYLLLVSCIAVSQSCKKFTEITPKGKNLLEKVSDLESILNYNYTLNGNVMVGSPAAAISAEDAFVFDDLNLLINDLYPLRKNVITELASPIKTLDYALMTGDETVNRAALTPTDIKYAKMYYIINNVANLVISNVDKAEGDKIKGNQLKAEAYMIRAWMHYLLVNIYAKAYNPATAANDPGIPYVKEGVPITEPNKKSTVAEVYQNILSDIDMAFSLNGLPKVPANSMRAGQGFAYAARARVFMSMRKYTEALEAANQSLDINNSIDDHRRYAPVGTAAFAHPLASGPEELFFTGGNTSLRAITLEIINNFYEPGDIIKDYAKPYQDLNYLSGIPGSLHWLNNTYRKNSAGLNTSDTYLIKAECLIRAGGAQNIAAAMQIINFMRERRIHPNVYAQINATTETAAIAALKKFSRIEFLFTVKNFLNLKRWNMEDGAYKETISRTISGQTYTIMPDSKLWIFPFPQNATDYNPNLSQNY